MTASKIAYFFWKKSTSCEATSILATHLTRAKFVDAPAGLLFRFVHVVAQSVQAEMAEAWPFLDVRLIQSLGLNALDMEIARVACLPEQLAGERREL